MDTKKDSVEDALHYMRSLLEVARESFLILNADLTVMLANPTFYKNFQVTVEETENVLLYELGNGQWNVSELRKLLEEILPEKKTVRDYEVTHVFESIGEKTIVLNAVELDSLNLIILGMEDVTFRQELADQVKELERLNKAMIGRELKMVELKNKLKNIEKPR